MKKFILFFRKNVQEIDGSCCSRIMEAFKSWHFNILNSKKDLFISYNSTLFNIRSLTKQVLLIGILCALLIPEKTFSQTINVNGNPDDWGPVLGAGSTVLVRTHVRDANDTNDSQFTGGSQDPDLISEWSWSLGNTNDKGDISNAAAAIIDNKLYFAGDRTAINGDAQIGFWFLLGGVAPVNGGTFSGTHVNGDLLALSNFTNGGGAVQIRLYRWTNGALAYVGTYNNAMVNSSPVFAPTAQVPAWTYQGKKLGSTTPAPNQYLKGAFFEGFIDLGDINIPDHCFQTFLLETRNSASVDASLQDLVANVFRAKPENPIVVGATRCGPGSVTLSVTCSDPALVTRWYADAQGGGTIPAPDTSNVTQDATYYVTCYNAQLNCESDRVPISIDIIDSPNAGDDGSTTVCETNTNPINLFNLISGEQPGGTWARSSGTGGNFNAGAGTFTPDIGATNSTFTYTITGVAPCPNDSSVATVNINAQPNAGNDGSTAICADSVATINLFSLITGEQPGGTWVRSSGSGGNFDAGAGTFTPGPGVTTSTFTYTLTATSPCVDDSSVATVTINPLPVVNCPQNASAPVLCGVIESVAQDQADTDFQLWLSQFAGLNPGLNSDYEINLTYTYSAGATPLNIGDAPKILAFTDPTIISTSVTVKWTVTNKITGCINDCSATWTLEFGCAVQCIATPTHVLCNGAATGSITVVASGGALPYNIYLYKLPDLVTPVAQVLNILTEGASTPFNNLIAGNYVAISTDETTTIENGSVCTANITQPSAVEASDSHTDVLCNGGSTGSVTLTFSGGTAPYMVSFNGGGFASQVSGVVYSDLVAGNYPWIVRDSNNCIFEGNETVGQPTALQASDSHTDVLCNGGSTGSVTINFSGGVGPYVVSFNGGGFASQVSGVVYSDLAAGNYPWIVRDANNCIYEGSETVGQPSALQASDSHTDAACNGGTGSVTLNFSGGTGPYMVSFNGGEFASQVSGVVYSDLTAGNYPWIVRDSNNCIFEGNETVGQPSTLQANDSHTDVLCNGGSTGSITLNFSGGTGPYMVSFNGGGFASQVSGVVYSDLAAGNYPWIVRDANNCIYEGSETVGQPSALQASDSHTDAACNGGTGSVTLNFSGGTGPYMVSFNGGGFASQVSGVVYSDLAAGNYPWIVRDANNCIFEGSETVGQPSAVQASDSHTDVLCNGGSTGSIALSFSGGTGPYMVNFNGGGFVSQVSGVVYSDLAAGNYPWIVRDANNCIFEGSETVGQPSALQASDSHTDAACNGGTGSITLNFSGGTGPYMVNFNGGGFVSQVSGVVYSNLAAGNYPWIVRDANNCIFEGSETVGQPSAVQASDSHTDVLCNGGSTGSVTINFSGGTAPYMVNFNGGGFVSQVSGVVYSNLAAGNYTWIVRDANNCIFEGSETVGQPSAIQASDSHTDVLCNGGSTGSVTINFSGGTAPYMVNFNGGGFASQVSGVVYTNLAAGNYPWIVRDANNCIFEGSETVGQPSAVQASDSHTDVLCNGGSTGSVTINFSGGTAPYMVNFNGGGFASQVSGVVYSNLAAGNYPWIVRDANNCISDGSEQVGQPTQVELSLTAEPENCTGTNTGSITATFSGGAVGYTISIDGGPFVPATSPHVFNNIGSGLHTVVVLDRNDCRDSLEIRVSATPCDTPHCTYTQGYYGAYNGSACTVEGGPTNDYLIMLDAITDVGGTFDFGRIATGNYFRLFSSDITGAANIANNKIFIMLPGGGTPRALIGYDYYDNPAAVPSSWRNDNNPLNKSGQKMGAINNNLLSQTMTLFFNTHVDPTLINFVLEVKFATQDVACGSSVPIPGTYKEFSIPSSVINYLASHGGATVGNLFNLANDALGGVSIGSLSHSDVNKAVDVVNNAFDECRVKVPLQVQSPQPTFVYNSLIASEPIFTVYPVPFRDQLTIRYQFEDVAKAKIDIYNSTGTLLMSQDDNNAYFNKEVTIIPKFNVGEAQLYFIKVTTDKGQSVLKVISEK